MTRREWVEKNMPQLIKAHVEGGVIGCPFNRVKLVEIDNTIKRDMCSRYDDCDACWSAELNENKRKSILEKAIETVNGQRQDEYGTPENSFNDIAKLWTAYNGNQYTAHDVAMMMALLKVARIKTGCQKEDSYVDLAGYTACAYEIAKNTIDKQNKV